MSTTLKRVRTITVGIAAGIIGATVFASAAQACHVEIGPEPEVECGEDGWTVTWEVTDWDTNRNETGKITDVESNTPLEGDIEAGSELPGYRSGDSLKAVQHLSFDDEKAEIEITAEWPSDGNAGPSRKTVSKPAGCDEPQGDQPTSSDEPSPSDTASSPATEPEPETEVSVGGWSDCLGITVDGANLNADALATITFVSSSGETVEATPAVGETFEQYFAVEDYEAGLSVEIYVDGELYDTIEWYDSELCHYASVESDCEGATFTLTVPEDGVETEFLFIPSTTGEEQGVSLAPGETQTVTITAVDNAAFTVYWEVNTTKDSRSGQVSWTPCPTEEESPSESATAVEQLPTTGSSLTIMIGSAAGLVLAAAVIFLVMRRRRAAQNW